MLQLGSSSLYRNDDITNPVPKDMNQNKDITIEEFLWEYKRLKWHQTSVKSTYANPAPSKAVGSMSNIVSSYSLNRINKKER